MVDIVLGICSNSHLYPLSSLCCLALAFFFFFLNYFELAICQILRQGCLQRYSFYSYTSGARGPTCPGELEFSRCVLSLRSSQAGSRTGNAVKEVFVGG